MANHLNSGALGSGASYPVSSFASYTVYAVSGSVVTVTAANKTATYTIGAGNFVTISDLGDSISVNAAFVVVGLLSTSQV